MYVAKILSHTVVFLHPADGFFSCAKHFSFMKSHLSIVGFLGQMESIQKVLFHR